MNNVDSAVAAVGQLMPAALSALGRLNTHDYHGVNNPAKLKQYRSLAQRLHKRIWMSELDVAFHTRAILLKKSPKK